MRAHPFDNRLRIHRKNQQLTRWNCRFIQRTCDRLFRHSGVHGAFVDIGGIDGMVHVSELSWSRIKNPAEVVSVGDTLDVYVISFDP